MQITEYDIGSLAPQETTSLSKIRGLEFRNRDEAARRTDQIAARRSNFTPVAAIQAFGQAGMCHCRHAVIGH